MKLIILGPPGSGKGTVSTKLAKGFKLSHISAGKILREEVKKKTTLGKGIKKYIQKGHLVPNQFVTAIIKLETKSKKNYILDGFPRSLEQAKNITDLKINKVIYLKVPEEIVIARLAGRRVCKNEHTYHLKFFKPKHAGICDIDKSKLIRRIDDQPKAIKERFKIYRQQTEAVIRYYKRKGILKEVDASHTPAEAYKNVKKVL